MDTVDPSIENLYKGQIEAYKEQIEILRTQNKLADDKNDGLLKKVIELQDLLDRARVANNDLNIAFEHVRDQQLCHRDQSSYRHDEDDRSTVQPNWELHYANLLAESVSWLSTKDKMSEKIKFLERQCERYNCDNLTLGKQVRHLLTTLEEERGTIIRRAQDVRRNPSGIMNSLDVIDEHLVTFESIEQLQCQNQRLLSMVKELSKDEEEKVEQLENEKFNELTGQITKLNRELEGVKENREELLKSFNLILKERDLFKILLSKERDIEHMSPEIFQKMITIACSSGPAITNNEVDTKDKDAHIADLKDIIRKLDRELNEVRQDLQHQKQLGDQELKLKSKLLEEAHAKIVAESELVERFRQENVVLNENFKTLYAEHEALRTKSQKMTFELSKIDEYKSRIDELKVELGAARMRNEQLDSEKNKALENEIKNIQKSIFDSESSKQKLTDLQLLRNMERKTKLKLTKRMVKMKNKLIKCRRIIVELHARVTERPMATAIDSELEVRKPVEAVEHIDLDQQQQPLPQTKQEPPRKIILKRRNL